MLYIMFKGTGCSLFSVTIMCLIFVFNGENDHPLRYCASLLLLVARRQKNEF